MSAAANLLAEFPPVSTAEWEAAIAADLKGASYDEKLIWKAPEGVSVRPYYRAADVAELNLPANPRAQAGWRIREEIAAADPAVANRAAVAAIAGGAEEIAFRSVPLENKSDLALLLANLDGIPVHFACATGKTVRLLLQWVHGNSPSALFSAGFDPFENLSFAAEILAECAAHVAPFAIDAADRAPANLNAVEQTGWALAAAVDFFGAMEEQGIDPARAAASVEIKFCSGSNYFFEIARLRAFRALWSRIVECFGGAHAQIPARIAARTAYPPTDSEHSHWNMLRATTQAMAAILGGADSVVIAPFAEPQDEAAARLARNTQLLLKQEAFFSRVADPGGGSYYLESLTECIAAQAWKEMQAIEARGGYRRARNQSQEGAGS